MRKTLDAYSPVAQWF